MAKYLAREGTNEMHRCAFCKHFFDPACSTINPKRGAKGLWEYESGIKKPCAVRGNLDTSSHHTCTKFASKM